MSRLCSTRFERAARKLGWLRIAGIDEAARGALFGPVVTAAVILNPRRRIVGLDDSIKLTSDRRPARPPPLTPQATPSSPRTTDDQPEALRVHGPSPLHRQSFAPVRDSACWAAGATQTFLPLS